MIGLILGPVAETNRRRAIAIGEGSPLVLVQSPFSVVVLATAVLAVVGPPVYRRARRSQEEEVTAG